MPNTSTIALLALAISLGAGAQLLMKTGMGSAEASDQTHAIALMVRPFVLGGVFCYGLSVIPWLLVVRQLPISVAYPCVSLSYVAVALGGWYFFDEPITLKKMLGLATIVLGVVLLGNSLSTPLKS